MSKTLLLTIGLAATVAACAPTDRPGPGFGTAVRNNMAAQIINPEPPPDLPTPEMGGVRANNALTRYDTNKVYKPQTLSTTEITTGLPAAGGGK